MFRTKKGDGQDQSQDSESKEIPIGDETTLQYGKYPLQQSQRQSGRTFTEVRELSKGLAGKEVWVRARIFTTRSKGNSAFLVLRRGITTVQATLFKSETVPKEMIKFAGGISKESIVDVLATVVVPEAPVVSVSQSDIELAVTKIFLLSSADVCPIQVEDCMRLEPVNVGEVVPGEDRPRVELKTRLDHRYLDLRAPVNIAIFRIQSAVGNLFREFLCAKGFVEIHTPKIIGAASEGGADVFRVDYFGRPAFLAQSPQLYKQMACVSDLERVFEIGPVFRAENSNTNRHLTEFMGLDLEMVFNEHYYEVLAVINEMFKYIFTGLEKRFAEELKAIRTVYDSAPVEFPDKFLIISFPEAIRMLREAGETVADLEDLSTPHEKMLGAIVKAKYNTDFYAIDRYPVNARPFYTMPYPLDKNYTNSYDIFLRGQEISSGAQRIHDPELLKEVARSKGVDPASLEAYVDSFRYGALPHAGCGIGLERVVMLYLGLHDVRKASMFPRDPKRTSP